MLNSIVGLSALPVLIEDVTLLPDMNLEHAMLATGHLLRVKDPETGMPLSDDLLVPEIGTMFIAGFETSSHTEAWSL